MNTEFMPPCPMCGSNPASRCDHCGLNVSFKGHILGDMAVKVCCCDDCKPGYLPRLKISTCGHPSTRSDTKCHECISCFFPTCYEFTANVSVTGGVTGGVI